MQIERKMIESSLSSKGFVREDTHHKYFYHEYQGKKTGVYTYTSHGSGYKTYSVNLLNMMKKQLKLETNRQVSDLFMCPLTEEDYNQISRDKGFIKH